MKVKQLREMIEHLNEDDEVYFVRPMHDYLGTELAVGPTELCEEPIAPSSNGLRILNDDERERCSEDEISMAWILRE